MTIFSRSDTSILGLWWWTIDRWTLAAVGVLIAFGIIMALAASPAVAERVGLDYFLFCSTTVDISAYRPLSNA